MIINEYAMAGFVHEFQKTAKAKQIAKILGIAGAGAAAGAGGAHIVGEKKRKGQLKELADLFRKANVQENKLIARRAYQAGAKNA